jgi:hypothetical protein
LVDLLVAHELANIGKKSELGPVWFAAHTSIAKKLVAYCILVYAWFVARILAANRYLFIFLIYSCQILGQVLAEDFSSKILVSQFLPIFGMAS